MSQYVEKKQFANKYELATSFWLVRWWITTSFPFQLSQLCCLTHVWPLLNIWHLFSFSRILRVPTGRIPSKRHRRSFSGMAARLWSAVTQTMLRFVTQTRKSVAVVAKSYLTITLQQNGSNFAKWMEWVSSCAQEALHLVRCQNSRISWF